MKLKLHLVASCFAIFTTLLNAQPANDDCNNSENIIIDETLQTVSFNITEAQTSNDIGCEGEFPDDIKDIWYNFTMPVDGVLEINSESINRFAIYDSCNGTQLACFEGSAFDIPYIIDNLTQNQNYILRVFRSSLLNNPNNQFFTVRTIVPAYPDCVDIQTITVTTDLQQIDIDINNATYNYMYGCDASDADQYASFWYDFTMPVNGNLVIATSGRNRVTILDACSGNIVQCYDNSANEDFLKEVIEDLVQGQTYVIRVYRQINDAVVISDESFSIRAFERLTNDTCATPEIISGLTSDNTQIFSQLAAGNVTDSDTCQGTSDGDLVEAFFEITMPITGNLLIDTPGGNGIAIYDACNGNEVFCDAFEGSTGAFKLISSLIEGDTYIIRFFNTEGGVSIDTPEAMNVRVYERAANDECIDAEVIPTISDIPQEVTFDTFGSLINFELSCLSQPEENFVDVWFEFTMPNYNYLVFETYILNFFNIYDACNGNEIICFAGNEVVEGLVPNQTYVLRLFQRQDLTMFHPNKSFNIYGSDNTLSNPETNRQDTQMKMFGNQTLMISNLEFKAKLSVYNMLGQQLLSKQLLPTTEQTFDLHVPSGVYIVHLEYNNSIEALKIVVRN